MHRFSGRLEIGYNSKMIAYHQKGPFFGTTVAALALVLLLAGCSNPDKLAATMTTMQPELLVTAVPASDTPVPASATATLRPTLPPTATNAATPTWTPEPPTPTPGPTLSEKDTETLILDLLHNNGGCELPCWWGFTPGKTDWTTARDFFLSKGEDFSDPTYLPFQKRGIFSASFRVEKYGFVTGATFFVENGIIRFITASGETYWLPDSIKFGDPFYLKAMGKYLLSEILISQGKPEQVYIYVIPIKALDLPDYYILLFYPEKGILVEYDGQSRQLGNDLRLCPQTAFVYLRLWAPEAGLSLKEAFSYDAFDSKENRLKFLNNFRPWDEISGKSIDDFVTTFTSQNTCFNTPAALWGRK
jgi:hypothetical protein